MSYPRNTSQIRSGNIRTVLDTIIKYGPLSKRDLQEMTGFSWGAVSTLTRELQNMGYVIPTEIQDTSIGRKPSLIDINNDDFFTIGIDLNIQGLCGIIVDLRGTVLFESCRTLAEKTKQTVINELFSLLDELCNEVCVNKTIMGIGIAVQGTVSPNEGISVRLPQVAYWDNVPLKHLISDRYKCENTMLLHDPDCLMIAEERFGNKEMRPAKNAILIRLDESIGFSMLADGSIYSGKNGRSGELAHIPVVPDGAVCTCGKRGCLEQYASGGGMVNRLREALSEDTSVTEQNLSLYGYGAIANAAKSGDTLSLKIFSDIGKYLGFALSGVINILNPEAVIIYGALTEYKNFF